MILVLTGRWNGSTKVETATSRSDVDQIAARNKARDSRVSGDHGAGSNRVPGVRIGGKPSLCVYRTHRRVVVQQATGCVNQGSSNGN